VLVRSPTVPARLSSRLSDRRAGIFNKRLVALLLFVFVSTVARVLTSYHPLTRASGSSNPNAVKLILDGLVVHRRLTLARSTSADGLRSATPKTRRNETARSIQFSKNQGSASLGRLFGIPDHLRCFFGGAL
jgi:hypothetical protein